MLKDFIKLYKNSIPISGLVPEENENFKCFQLKTGLPVSMVIVKDTIKYQYPIKTFWKYFEENPCFWMIPLATPSKKIIGFVLRGYDQKEYRTVFNYKDSVPPIFGWEDFSDFSYDKPVVICEGVKDAIWLKQYYKYCLALNGSEITTSNLEIFKNVISKIVLCYDNDKDKEKNVGKKSTNKEENRIHMILTTSTDWHVQHKVITPEHKDCAMFLDNSLGLDKFLNKLKFAIEDLGGVYEVN